MRSSRREFLMRSAAAGAIVAGPFSNLWNASNLLAKDVNSQLKLAAIGVGGSRGTFSRGGEIARSASRFARMIAVCDVDSVHTAEFNKSFGGKLAEYTDYRKLLEKEKPDVVTIGTPDHWHVPIAVAAMHTGCDVYCEKPLTLTIDEGKLIRDAVKKTGRVFQVGTQQRSEFNLYFLQALAIVKSGRLGKNVNAYLAAGESPSLDGPFPNSEPPPGLDWDMWVGPAQSAEYSIERRNDFRWYFDYSGGKLTDWGAHHIDIAQWGLGHDRSGPVTVSATGKFGPVVPDHFDWIAYMAGHAQLPNGFQTAPTFEIDCRYEDGSLLHICNHYDRGDGRTKFKNGILFEGEEGRILVDRGELAGKPIDEMGEADKKDLHEQVVKLYGGEPGDHMRNFFDAVKKRGVPISDVETHHRTMTVCHLCNISLMLGREVKWDPKQEQFAGDEQATMLMSRPRREKYSWEATT